MRFEFATATRIIFGPGTLKEAGAIGKELGQRALIVATDRGWRRAELLANLLTDAGIIIAPHIIGGETDLKTVEDGITAAKRLDCDFVVGFGGGSAIDAGKAIAAMLANEGALLDYLEVV